MPTIIHVVDDDASFRRSIDRLLRSSGYDVELYESADQLLQQLPDDTEPGCILLDIQIPGLSGTELQIHLVKSGSTMPIVFLTGHGDIPTTVQVIKAGAEDFLTKPVSKDKLLGAIERALAKHRVALERNARLRALQNVLRSLTPRERQVFDLVVRGKMNKEIAFALGITERTTKAHRQKVMDKTEAKSLAELVSIAERLGALTVEANHQVDLESSGRS